MMPPKPDFQLTITEADREAAQQAVTQNILVTRCCLIWQALKREGHPVTTVSVCTASNYLTDTFYDFDYGQASAITLAPMEMWNKIELPITLDVWVGFP